VGITGFDHSTIPVIVQLNYPPAMQGDILQQTIEAALRMGYRHIDTAQMYKNHVHIGKVFARMFAAGGELNRKDCHITSKVWLHIGGRHYAIVQWHPARLQP
jgi:diketogulonate reductase-like aldo/keto reductase